MASPASGIVLVRQSAAAAQALAFALTLFTSALLIFLVQPIAGRLLTPLLGGAPAVWNTVMVFFQAALLAGYAYAYAVARLRSLRAQVGVVTQDAVLIRGTVAENIRVGLDGASDEAVRLAARRTQVRRWRRVPQHHAARGFVNHINRLIWQLSIADVANGELYSRSERLIRDANLMVRLVSRA
jgi:hypothetical protein